MAQPTQPVQEDDDDPVVARYSVFLKPALPEHRKLFVLQHPNLFGQDPQKLPIPQVQELRIKPGAGIVEADVPIDTSGDQYDRHKGKAWGAALRKTVAAKDGGSLGLAGGFGVGAPPIRAGPGGRRAGSTWEEEAAALPWAEAMRQDLVLRTKTIGGRAVDTTDANYMIAVFQGKAVHLTPVSSLVTLRPNLPHIDATSEQDRLSRSSAAATSGTTTAKEGGPARAIHMTLKAAMDDDGVATETITDRLKAVQTESWVRMQYAHEESEKAWEAYQECLLLAPPPARADADKGKEPAQSHGEDDEVGSLANLLGKVPDLQADWEEADFLRAVSGIVASEKKPGEELPAAAAAAAADASKKGKEKEVAVKTEGGAEPKKRPGRPPKAATEARRGGRSKA